MFKKTFMATMCVQELPKVRVLDQVISILAFARQSQDLDEADEALKLEREMVERRKQAISETAPQRD